MYLGIGIGWQQRISVAAIINSITNEAQTTSTLGFDIDMAESSAVIYGILPQASTTPNATQLTAGTDGDDVALTVFDNTQTPAAGVSAATLTLVFGMSGNYKLCAMISGGSSVEVVKENIPIDTQIQATTAPVAEVLVDDMTLDQIANYATLMTTGNYTSYFGTVTSVQSRVNNVSQAGTFAVSVGERVIIRVADDQANVTTWEIEDSVEEDLTFSYDSGTGLIDATWNANAPTGHQAAATIDRGAGAEAITFTKGATVAANFYKLLDHTIQGSTPVGSALSTNLPSIFTYDSTGATPGAKTHQWDRDTVAISGATSEGYTTVSLDAGTAVTRDDSVTQGVETRTATSNAINVDAASGVTKIDIFAETDGTNTVTRTHNFNGTALELAAGDFLVVATGGTLAATSTADLDATPMNTHVFTHDDVTNQEDVRFMIYTLQAGDISTSMTVTLNKGTSSVSNEWQIFAIQNSTATPVASTGNGAAASDVTALTDTATIAVADSLAVTFLRHRNPVGDGSGYLFEFNSGGQIGPDQYAAGNAIADVLNPSTGTLNISVWGTATTSQNTGTLSVVFAP